MLTMYFKEIFQTEFDHYFVHLVYILPKIILSTYTMGKKKKRWAISYLDKNNQSRMTGKTSEMFQNANEYSSNKH